MTNEEIQHILEKLHHHENHTFSDFDKAYGSSWSGYSRDGYEVIYYPQTNSYTWEFLRDNDYAGIERGDAFEISEADLRERLREINYTI